MRKACLIVLLVSLMASLAQAQSPTGVLESPAHGSSLSGIGFISGWKCDGGTITVTIDGGGHIPVATGQPRADTRPACGTTDNGFITQINWNHMGDGEHTAVAYDDGVKFASATFTVVTTGEEFLSGVEAQCTIPDFPAPGEEARFIWNESTQHLELAEVGESEDTLPPATSFHGVWSLVLTDDGAVSPGVICSGGHGTMYVSQPDGRGDSSMSGELHPSIQPGTGQSAAMWGALFENTLSARVSPSGVVEGGFSTAGVASFSGILSGGSGEGTWRVSNIFHNAPELLCTGTWHTTKQS